MAQSRVPGISGFSKPSEGDADLHGASPRALWAKSPAQGDAIGGPGMVRFLHQHLHLTLSRDDPRGGADEDGGWPMPTV